MTPSSSRSRTSASMPLISWVRMSTFAWKAQQKRFCCAFQAKVDIRTQDIRGIEALVRLRDDDGVIQAPGTFVNLAVELGLIDELTHLVLAEIVKSIDLINDTFGPDTSISINVAARQAGNPQFMRPFALALEATGYPKRFMIEVTEDAFVSRTKFCRCSASSELGSRSTISALAIPRCRRWPTSLPTKSRSTGRSSPTSISARAARGSCGRSNR